MVEKDKNPTNSRTRSRQRSHISRLTPKRSTKSQLSRADASQIANYCPIISRSTLVKNSTSLEFIWQTIRQHFGFQATGAQFIVFSDIDLAVDKRLEDLCQGAMALVEDTR